MSDIIKKAIIARLRDFPTDLNVQAADIIEELMAERDRLLDEIKEFSELEEENSELIDRLYDWEDIFGVIGPRITEMSKHVKRINHMLKTYGVTK